MGCVRLYWLWIILAGAILSSSPAEGAELRGLSEWVRPDPFGGVVASDREGSHWLDRVQLNVARGGYASFQFVVTAKEGEATDVALQFPLPVDLYREWFHLSAHGGQYQPDALIPIPPRFNVRMPEAANRIAGQTSQAFWVDIWIPADAAPQIYRGSVQLSDSSGTKVLPLELHVGRATIPDRDVVTLDNNSYGTSWLLEQYPETLAKLRQGQGGEDELFHLIHEYHRIFYDHRGTFHQLGYGHAGKVGPEFAPELSGTGRQKHIVSWARFDRHYGPLLDGSAFRASRRGPRPIPFMYLPVNPEWPASFLWWGEPGYEAEFVNILSGMERHFREKGWTSTEFEVFFNHKKRYKGFSWDGDEIRFASDSEFLKEYARLVKKAVPAASPVHFVMRADTSWTMEHQFSDLKDIIRFWVAGEGMLSWYPGAISELKQRGDRVWTYGGTPATQEISTAITLNPLRSWISGVDGFVRWLTVSPGPDPWFNFEGGRETLVYPGERFGVAGPLPAIRLKLQRNCLQDLALLERAAATRPRTELQEHIVQLFNHTRLADWSNKRPPMADGRPLDWTNNDIEDAMKPFEVRFSNLDPGSWQRVREYVLEISQ